MQEPAPVLPYSYVKGASGWPTKPTAILSDPKATAGDSFGWGSAVSGRPSPLAPRAPTFRGAPPTPT